jgi:hypothetical protein
VAEDVNWSEYFAKIKSVCAWSGSAYRKAQIDFHVGLDPKTLDQYSARIYILNNTKPRLLKKLADRMQQTRPDELWFFSYPTYGKFATPVNCLIQQDRYQLESIRFNLNKNNLDK